MIFAVFWSVAINSLYIFTQAITSKTYRDCTVAWRRILNTTEALWRYFTGQSAYYSIEGRRQEDGCVLDRFCLFYRRLAGTGWIGPTVAIRHVISRPARGGLKTAASSILSAKRTIRSDFLQVIRAHCPDARRHASPPNASGWIGGAAEWKSIKAEARQPCRAVGPARYSPRVKTPSLHCMTGRAVIVSLLAYFANSTNHSSLCSYSC